MADTPALASTIQARFPEAVWASHRYLGQETILIKRRDLVEVARVLRDDPPLAFDFLMDVACLDYLKFGKSLGSAPTMATPGPLPYYMQTKSMPETWARGISHDAYRFEVVYHFYSSRHNHRLRVKVPLTAAEPTLASLTDLWASANWYEREVWDMFGIGFTGHPNLTRILMYEEFQGFPLRKDYPVRKRQPLVGPVN